MNSIRSASLKRGGGLVTPESSDKVVGINCNIKQEKHRLVTYYTKSFFKKMVLPITELRLQFMISFVKPILVA